MCSFYLSHRPQPTKQSYKPKQDFYPNQIYPTKNTTSDFPANEYKGNYTTPYQKKLNPRAPLYLLYPATNEQSELRYGNPCYC